MIEVQRLHNSYCQLLNPFGEMDPTQQIKDTSITNLSTWMLTTEEGLIPALAKFSKDDALPITVKVRFAAKEETRCIYSNMTVEDFMTSLESFSALESSQMKLRVVEETLTRRIDTKTLNEELLPNTLKDVKVVHNTQFLLETKDGSEVDEDGNQLPQDKSSTSKKDADVEYLDDSENMRTIIVNTEYDKSSFQRYQVNIDQTLSELLPFLKEKFNLEGEHRLRSLTEKKAFCKEEMDSKLRQYEEFREGGARVQIEQGRPTTMAEISLKVLLHPNEEDIRFFYFNADISVAEAKMLCALEFQ